MINYKKCSLFGLKSKKKLFEILNIKRKLFRKQNFVSSKIQPILKMEHGKKRLVEIPDDDLIQIQRKLLKILQVLECPDYVFSGIKNKSYVDNGKLHENKKSIYKTDISKFFPCITRQKVYEFFTRKLLMSQDVAEIVTNFATINVSAKRNCDEIKEYLKVNNLPCNHLITGSPLSPFLSYLVNENMFQELYELACRNNLTVSVYIDDVIFSSDKNYIPKGVRAEILNIIHRNGYKTSSKKCRFYDEKQQKIITGTVINSRYKQLQPPYSLIHKAHLGIKGIKSGNIENIKQTRGYISAVNLIDKNRFSIYKKQILRGCQKE